MKITIGADATVSEVLDSLADEFKRRGETAQRLAASAILQRERTMNATEGRTWQAAAIFICSIEVEPSLADNGPSARAGG